MNQPVISRQAFVRSAGAVAAVAGAGMLGATVARAEEAATEEPAADAPADAAPASGITAADYEGKWAFEIAPEPITDIAETVEAELVVVGAGYAGMATATSAQQSGVQTVLVSASSMVTCRGGSNNATYSRVMEAAGIGRDDFDIENVYQEEIVSACGNRVDSTKWSRYANSSEEAMNWLLDLTEARGVGCCLEICNSDPDDPRSPTHMFPASHCFITEDMTFAGIGQGLAMDALEDEFLQQGGTIYYNNVAKQLTRDGVPNGTTGRVDGVIAQNDQGAYVLYKASKAVVLATGDFSRDRDMLAKYCPQAIDFVNWEKAAYWDEEEGYDYGLHPDESAGLFHGDGHKMGLWVGAAWQKTVPCATNVQGSWVCATQPYGSHRGLIVNKNGIRYNNEDCNGGACAMAQQMQPDHASACIWGLNYAEDAAPWHTFGQHNGDPGVDPAEIVAGWDDNVEAGTYFKCDTIEELAEALGLPVEQTVATVERYNELCDGGRDLDFFKKAKYMVRIDPPFYGAWNTLPQFFTVHGGLRTNTNMQVCDANDEPIPGLYNVGTMVGDFFSNIYTFRIQGQSYGSCLTFGYLTGKYIAENE